MITGGWICAGRAAPPWSSGGRASSNRPRIRRNGAHDGRKERAKRGAHRAMCVLSGPHGEGPPPSRPGRNPNQPASPGRNRRLKDESSRSSLWPSWRAAAHHRPWPQPRHGPDRSSDRLCRSQPRQPGRPRRLDRRIDGAARQLCGASSPLDSRWSRWPACRAGVLADARAQLARIIVDDLLAASSEPRCVLSPPSSKAPLGGGGAPSPPPFFGTGSPALTGKGRPGAA